MFFYIGYVLIVIVVILYFWTMSNQSHRIKEKEKRGEEMIARAINLRGTFHWHRHENVLAVCTDSDFQSAFNVYKKEVEEGKRKRVDKIVLWVAPTFTFGGKLGAQTLMHVCSEEDAMPLIEELLVVATGIRKEDVSEYAFNKAFRKLFCTDGRLFVPFSGGIPDAERQELFFGQQTLGEARDVLMWQAIQASKRWGVSSSF